MPLLAALPPASPRRKIDEYDSANAKLAHRVFIRRTSDEDLLFLQQIGMRWIHCEFGGEPTPYEVIRATQDRLARFNIKIYCGVHDSYRSIRLQLGQAGRDQDIETFQRFLRDCGRAGIPVAKIDWHPANTYTTAMVQSPRNYRTREFKLADFRAKVEKQRYEREYSADDIWSSFTYFLKAVLPVAKEANVRLALHPDDPPVSKMNGVAKIFVHYDGYRRADEIAERSPYFGLTFCIGTWSEGGKQMGKDVFEIIQDFGGRNKIFTIHFRNVSGVMPEFYETFPEEGYQDMYRVMKSLRQVKFSGSMVPDHVPELAGDTGLRRAGTAYIIAYMRALLERANEEAG
jgi:mannonate dehydratase